MDCGSFFVFLHPNEVKNEIAVSQLVTRFCRVTGMSEDEAKEATPYGFTTENELREMYLREWWEKTRNWIPADAFDTVEDFAKDTQKWTHSVDYDELKTCESYFQQFDRIFFEVQLERFLGSQSISGKQKTAFREYLLSKFGEDPSGWIGKIESSFSREAVPLRIPGSDVFHAALEDFKDVSLDRYTKREPESMKKRKERS